MGKCLMQYSEAEIQQITRLAKSYLRVHLKTMSAFELNTSQVRAVLYALERLEPTTEEEVSHG